MEKYRNVAKGLRKDASMKVQAGSVRDTVKKPRKESTRKSASRGKRK